MAAANVVSASIFRGNTGTKQKVAVDFYKQINRTHTRLRKEQLHNIMETC